MCKCHNSCLNIVNNPVGYTITCIIQDNECKLIMTLEYHGYLQDIYEIKSNVFSLNLTISGILQKALFIRKYELETIFITFFLNIDISVTIKAFDLTFSMYVLGVPLEGDVSLFRPFSKLFFLGCINFKIGPK